MSVSTEKPLHVRVAEALGWTNVEQFEADGIVAPDVWCGDGPARPGFVPDYDTNWSAAGPLIERFKIHLQPETRVPWAALAWREEWGSEYVGEGEGDTPLMAVCHLILVLHAAGKL